MPEEVIYHPPMTEAEARQLIDEIREHLSVAARHEEMARRKAKLLYDTEAWRLLGYESFADCAETELGVGFQQAYRLLDAAKVDESLREELGIEIVVPETYARHLKQLSEPGERADAYRSAERLAHHEGVSLAARHVQEAVRRKQIELKLDTEYRILGYLAEKGDMSLNTAQDVSEMLDKIYPGNPDIGKQILAWIGRYSLIDARLIPELANMLMRQGTGRESKVLPEILHAGTIGGTPFGQATMTDLERAREEARNEHIAEAQEKKRQEQLANGEVVIEPVVTTVYKGDPSKTLEALKQALGPDDFERLCAAMRERSE